jgi:hypothetical protein
MAVAGSWLNWLVWPRRIDGQITETALRAYPLLGTAATAIAGVLLLALALWIARAKGLDLSARRRFTLGVLRILAICCLVPMLIDLSLHVRLRHRVKPTLAVAVDTSQSMSLRDRYVTPAQQQELTAAIGKTTTGPAAGGAPSVGRIDLAKAMLLRDPDGRGSRLTQLGVAADLRLFAFDATARLLNGQPASAVEGLDASGQYTDLLAGIDEMVNRLRGQPTAGILLISDGANNTGGSPLAACPRWKQAGVSVHTVTVGDPNPKDIEIRQVLANELLFSDDPATVVVRLRQRGYQQPKVPVILRSGAQELGRAEASFGEGNSETTVSISFTPTQGGEHTFRVECQPQPDETVEQNNRRSFVARVTTDKIRVLYLESRPRWQYRFLRDAMNRDRRLKVQILLTGAESTPNPPPPMVASLPATREAYKNYDLFILGDFDPSMITADQMEWIGAMVRDEGAGALLMAGPAFNPRAYLETPLADLFPVEASDEAGRSPQRPRAGKQDQFLPELTPLGQTFSAIQLADEAEGNLEQWRTLPAIYWYASVRKARPGATVLAVHPSERIPGTQDERMPLLAVQNSGKGKSFYSGIDETWRWRFKQGDRIFYRLWGQVIQYLGTGHLGGANQRVNLWADRTVYNPNDAALISVRVEELTGGELPAVVEENENGQRQKVLLTPSPGAEHMYEARVPLVTPGLHRLWVDGHALEASAIVEVQAPQRELVDPAANLSLMKETADNTGGRAGGPGEIDALLKQIDLAPRAIEEQRDYRLWDRPALVLLFVGLLAVEWILRRLWQLP